MKSVLAIAAAMLIFAAIAGPAGAAAPRYIIVSGPGLQRPVTLRNWNENLRFLISLLPAKRPRSGWHRVRPRLDLALFWGVPAKPIPNDPRDANQHGWFYPAIGGRRAVVTLLIGGRDDPRVATPEALRILARNGIPIRARDP